MRVLKGLDEEAVVIGELVDRPTLTDPRVVGGGGGGACRPTCCCCISRVYSTLISHRKVSFFTHLIDFWHF